MNQPVKRFIWWVGLLVALFVLTACGGNSSSNTSSSGSAEAPSYKIRIAYSSISPSTLPLWVAQEKGLFEKYHVDADVLYIEGGSAIVQALTARQADLGSAAGSSLVLAVAGGSDLVAVNTVIDRYTDELLVGKNIKKPEDLKGKSAAISRPGSTTDVLTRAALKELGLEPEKDVALLPIGDETARFAALAAGNVLAAVNEPPATFAANAQGFESMVKLSETDIKSLKTGMYTSPGFLKENRDAVIAYLKAYIEATHYLKTHKKEAAEIWGKNAGTSDKPEENEKLMDIYAPIFSYEPLVSKEALEADKEFQVQANAEVNKVDVDSIIDNSVVQELIDSGWIEQLKNSK